MSLRQDSLQGMQASSKSMTGGANSQGAHAAGHGRAQRLGAEESQAQLLSAPRRHPADGMTRHSLPKKKQSCTLGGATCHKSQKGKRSWPLRGPSGAHSRLEKPCGR